jgi:membrane-associated phospholipid phosphatase
MSTTTTKSLSDLSSHFMSLFWGIGYFGWHISTLYALYVSYGISWMYFFIYSIVFVLTSMINRVILKKYINDPRPRDPTRFLAADHFRKRMNGMPSGHAQYTAFSLTYAYLLSGKQFYASWALFFITVLQRYVFKNHTFLQLLMGSILGFLLAQAFVYFLKKTEENKNKKLFLSENF